MTVPKPEFSLAPEQYDALTRLDFWVFLYRVFAELTGELLDDNFHIQLLCGAVDRLRTESIVRLAVALPPRSLKSIIISIALPAWLLGHDPGIEIVCVSYGQELSDKLATDCRQVMLSHWYRRLFPGTRLDRQAVGHLSTTRGGMRYATSVGGSLTGIGADVIIVDDPMKPEEAFSDAERNTANRWTRHTLFTRLNHKGKGRIIVVQQRLHEDDMIGHIMEIGGFELLSFPAIAQEDEVHLVRTPFGNLTHTRKPGEALHPSREPLEVLEQLRVLLGTEFFSAQYLQSPVPPGGGLVKTDWFIRYDFANRPSFKRIIQSWDCASKPSQLSDYCVCTTWGEASNKDIYLLHVFRQRLEYPELKRKVVELAKTHGAGVVLIEDAAAGVQLVQELKLGGLPQVRAVKPQGDKIMRMQAQTATIEAGRVWVPREAQWVPDYLHELAMFPKGRHDDQVDSTAQALAFIGKPNEADRWIEFMRERTLQLYDITGSDLTIKFDHPVREREFWASSGRLIGRESDGFYHCTPREWDSIKHFSGVELIE